MNILPFSKLLTSERQLKIGIKNATGLVEDWESLMDADTIELLRESNKHVYCFLAFNKKVDEEIFNYIKTGALGAESGDEIVILYTINKAIRSPRYIENDELAELLTITNEKNSTIEILKAHFPDGNALMLPGILIFDDKPYSSKSVYVPLSGNEKLDKITYFRNVLGILKKATAKSKEEDKSLIDELNKQFLLERIEYDKNSSYTFAEYVIKTFRILMKFKGEIVALFV